MVTSRQNSSVTKFEAWLKPGLFYALLILLILLNLFVWFGWLGRPAAVAGLQAERAKLQDVLNAPCDFELLRNYRGTQPALPNGNPAVPGASPPSSAAPPSVLVGLLESAAVMVFHPKGFGTGFFIDAQTIVTNRHVIEGIVGGTVNVGNRTIGSSVKATIISATRGSDIGGADFALLRIAQPIPGITPLAIAGSPTPLQRVIAVGFPGSGIQSDANRDLPAPLFTSGDVNTVQPQASGVSLIIHTADISPGSSGGALVDQCGAVVGVNTFVMGPGDRAEGRRLYALSSDTLRKFLDSSGQRYTTAGRCQAGPAS